MLEQNFIITSEEGVHARPASKLVNVSSTFDDEITLEYKNKEVNLKSIMGIMGLGIRKQSNIKIIVQGDTEVEAMKSITDVLKEENIVDKQMN